MPQSPTASAIAAAVAELVLYADTEEARAATDFFHAILTSDPATNEPPQSFLDYSFLDFIPSVTAEGKLEENHPLARVPPPPERVTKSS